MQRFFSAVETFSGKPLVNKNNKLNTYAHLVAESLDTSYFICLDRNPVFLAQSLLEASRYINGDEHIPYGVNFSKDKHAGPEIRIDPVAQVCNQVRRYREISFKQEQLIGKGRFYIVPYEDFCADPAKWVCRISEEILGKALDIKDLRKELQPFSLSNHVRIEQDSFAKIKNAFESKLDAK